MTLSNVENIVQISTFCGSKSNTEAKMSYFACAYATNAILIHISIVDIFSRQHMANFVTGSLMVFNCITPDIKKLLKDLN